MNIKEFIEEINDLDRNILTWHSIYSGDKEVEFVPKESVLMLAEELDTDDDIRDLISNIQQWFKDRNLVSFHSDGQVVKLFEECTELLEAYNNGDHEAMQDAVGDITVVLIGFCLQRGFNFLECLEVAYDEIKDRKGKVVNGIFVKEE